MHQDHLACEGNLLSWLLVELVHTILHHILNQLWTNRRPCLSLFSSFCLLHGGKESCRHGLNHAGSAAHLGWALAGVLGSSHAEQADEASTIALLG